MAAASRAAEIRRPRWHPVELAFNFTGKLGLSPLTVGKAQRPQQARTKGSTGTELESAFQRFFGSPNTARPRTRFTCRRMCSHPPSKSTSSGDNPKISPCRAPQPAPTSRASR